MADLGTRPLPGDSPVPIGDALRGLALAPPPRSAWPRVAPRRDRAWNRALASLATAAALALAFVLPVPTPTTPAATGVDPTVLADLQRTSAQLERLVAASDEDPLQPADALVLSLGFEAALAGIDAELAAARPGSREAHDHWQRRVGVLSRYAALQSSRRLLASAGQPFETTLVALH